MLPAGVAQVSLRKFIIELNITGQAYSDMSAFNQVVAQQPLFWKPPGQHPTEGAHVIDTLAMVGAFTGQILIDIGNSLGVWVNPTASAKSRLKGEPLVLGSVGLTRGWMMV